MFSLIFLCRPLSTQSLHIYIFYQVHSKKVRNILTFTLRIIAIANICNNDFIRTLIFLNTQFTIIIDPMTIINFVVGVIIAICIYSIFTLHITITTLSLIQISFSTLMVLIVWYIFTFLTNRCIIQKFIVIMIYYNLPFI